MKFLRIPLIVALLGAGMNTQAAPLDLDTSFDGDGMLSANYGAGTNSYFEDVEITPDDKIIAVGFAQKANSTYDLLLVKYNLDGTLDNSFGTNGKVNLPVENDARGTALVIQPDGKFLVAGHSKGASVKWRLYIKRFNVDGSEDLGFTGYTYAPSVGGQIKDIFAKDIGLTPAGKILVGIQEHNFHFAGSDVSRSRLIRLNVNGGLDTSFGTNGFTDRSSTGLSYEDDKFTLDNAGNIYVPGRRRQPQFIASNHVEAMTLAKFNQNGAAQGFGGSSAGWKRRSNITTFTSAGRSTDKLFSSLVLPNGNIVSAGCTDSSFQSRSSHKATIQVQNSSAVFQNTFSAGGVYSDTSFPNTALTVANHCYRDVTYHPGVGLVAVGGMASGSTQGSLYVSAVNASTGASIQASRLIGTPDNGYLKAAAITAGGKIVSVGFLNNPRESVIMMMEGAPLPASNLAPLSFTDVLGAPVSSLQTGGANNNITITPSAVLSAHVYGGTALVNNLVVSNPFTLSDGDALSLQHTSSATENTITTTDLLVNDGTGFHRNNKMWKVGDTFTQFSSTTLVIDTVPDAFSFTGFTNAQLNSTQQSAAVNISGINTPATINVSAGSFYCINSSPCTNVSGMVNNGDAVVIRHTSANTFSSAVTSTLTVGGVSATFVSTTGAQDTTPDAFSFPAKTAVSPGTTQTFTDITVAGINSAVSISVSGGGSYSINSGSASRTSFTSSPSTVNNGDTVTVRHTSSSSFATTVTSALTIGGVSANFVSTTEAQDTTPDAFVLQPGGLSSAAVPGSVRYSQIFTVAGINSAAPISIVSGSYSVNGGAYISSNGTVNNGDVIRVRHSASNSFSTTVTSTLTIGGVSATFSSMTEALDTTPNAFSFGLINGRQPLNATLTSQPVSILAINSAAPISVTNGEYSINGGAFTAVNGTVSNGQSVRVRQVTAGTFSTQKTTTLNVGGVFANFLSTTIAQDTTPNGFNFGPRVDGQLRSTQVTSGSVTVAGINSAAAISVTGGEYQINNGAFTSSNGTVNVGDTVILRQTTASSFSTLQRTELTVGGVTGTFETRTEDQDTTPDAFAVVAQSDVALSTLITSAEVTVAGINATTAISIKDGEYSLNGAAFTDVAGTLENGDTVIVRHTSSSSHSTEVSTEITVGTVVGIFKSTTKAANAPVAATPDPAAAASGGGGGGSMGFVFLFLAVFAFLRRRIL